MADANRDRRLATGAVAVVVGFVSCCGCGSLAQTLLLGRMADQEEVVRPVRTIKVAESGGAVTRSFTGTARAGDQARLSFKVAGSVREIRVKVGDRVEKGQVIAKLDPVDLALQVQQLDAAIAQAEAFARNARATYDRTRGMYVEDNASHADLDAARASAESAAASASAARKQRAMAAQQLAYASIEATSSGSVVEVLANVGENVAPGQPIATLASEGKPEIVIGVPASLISRVTEGQGAVASFPALGDRDFVATVSEVGVATSVSSAYPVTVRIDEDSEAIRAGMSAEVTLDFAPTEDRSHLRIPAVALTEDTLGRHVWVVDPQPNGLGTVHRREVQTGELTSEGVDVVDGLFPGDRVVTAGTSRVQDGQVVRLSDPDPAPAPVATP